MTNKKPISEEVREFLRELVYKSLALEGTITRVLNKGDDTLQDKSLGKDVREVNNDVSFLP